MTVLSNVTSVIERQDWLVPAADAAARMDFPTVAATTQEYLGANLVVYIAGVSEPRAAKDWAGGLREPKDPWVETRLRTALMCVLVLGEHENTRTARSWFSLPNPLLDNWSPADAIREGPSPRWGERLLDALKHFCFGAGVAGVETNLASETQLLSRATGSFDEAKFDSESRETAEQVLTRMVKPGTRRFLRSSSRSSAAR
jgi:hypothetical protein